MAKRTETKIAILIQVMDEPGFDREIIAKISNVPQRTVSRSAAMTTRRVLMPQASSIVCSAATRHSLGHLTNRRTVFLLSRIEVGLSRLSDTVCPSEVGTFLENLFFLRWVLFLFNQGLREIVTSVMPDLPANGRPRCLY